MPNFIDIDLLSKEDIRLILDSARELKKQNKNKISHKILPDYQLAMIFEKPSTRTRVSFEVGINQLGGNAIILNYDNMQLGRGENPSDTAKVLSRYVDGIMIRCFSHDMLLEFSSRATVPVINALTDYSHPCQIMADILTFEEHKGDISGKNVAWVGDGNNVAVSWIHAAAKLGFNLSIATPSELKPNVKVIEWAKNHGAKVKWTNSPHDAVLNADLVTTDTWVSMGDKEEEKEKRKKLLSSYQVDSHLMGIAKKDAIFMHCLPAHREEEVTSDVIDGARSVIFDEAENRLHVQKSILIWCFGRRI